MPSGQWLLLYACIAEEGADIRVGRKVVDAGDLAAARRACVRTSRANEEQLEAAGQETAAALGKMLSANDVTSITPELCASLVQLFDTSIGLCSQESAVVGALTALLP